MYALNYKYHNHMTWRVRACVSLFCLPAFGWSFFIAEIQLSLSSSLCKRNTYRYREGNDNQMKGHIEYKHFSSQYIFSSHSIMIKTVNILYYKGKLVLQYCHTKSNP